MRRTSISTRWAARASARSASSAAPPPSPTPSTTRPACASAACRSGSTTCSRHVPDAKEISMPDTIQEHLTAYLSDAHSIEEQALAQLRSIPRLEGADRLAEALRLHLAETENHERSVKQLLESREARPSWFKDAVMQLGGKGFILFAKLNPDTPGKLLAHAYSYEALEEASYALLGIVAREAGEDDVAECAARIE